MSKNSEERGLTLKALKVKDAFTYPNEPQVFRVLAQTPNITWVIEEDIYKVRKGKFVTTGARPFEPTLPVTKVQKNIDRRK